MVSDRNPDIVGITETWANTIITDPELGLPGHVMFGKNMMGKRREVL